MINIYVSPENKHNFTIIILTNHFNCGGNQDKLVMNVETFDIIMFGTSS